MGVNGVPVAPHGLILGEDEATPSRKVFKYLPGPLGPVFGPKIIKNRNSKKNSIFIYVNSRSTAPAAVMLTRFGPYNANKQPVVVRDCPFGGTPHFDLI